MKLYLEFTHDEIQREFPYALICETTEGARWNTGKRRWIYNNLFNEKDRETCREIMKKAHSWYLGRGVPESVKMTPRTYTLWKKLGDFCASL